MIPKFTSNQNAEERIKIIQGVLDLHSKSPCSAEVFDTKILNLFGTWGGVFDLVLQAYPDFERFGKMKVDPIAVYNVGDPDFGALPNKDINHSQKVSGPLFDQGLLVDLLEVLMIIDRLGITVSADISNSFKNNHLATINEFLALGVWHNVKNLGRNFKAIGSKKDVDWKFETDHLKVLLEVKYRRFDWRRGHPETEVFNPDNLFDDILPKFPKIYMDDTLRVAQVTLVHSPDKEILDAAENFALRPEIDVLILQHYLDLWILGRSREAEKVRNLTGLGRFFQRPPVTPIIFKRPSARS